MKVLAIIVQCLLVSCNLFAFNLVQPKGLDILKMTSVYSARQAPDGSIWLDTKSGIYRFNGHRLDSVHEAATMNRMSEGSGPDLFISDRESILRVDTRTRTCSELKVPQGNYRNAVFSTEGGTLMVASADRLFSLEGDSLSVKAILPPDMMATSLLRADGGPLLVGTSRHGIAVLGEDFTMERNLLPERQTTVVQKAPDGSLWVGFRDGGIARLEGGGEFGCLFSEREIAGTKPRNVRAFAFDRNGTVYVASASGLFSIDAEGHSEEIPIGGRKGSPICDLLIDRDSNLWVCTFYDGVFLATPGAWPFEEIAVDEGMRWFKACAAAPDGTIWAFTDGHGQYRMTPKGWKMVSGSYNTKYQCAFYDSESASIWSGEYQGDLIRTRVSDGTITRYRFARQPRTIVAVKRFGEDLYLAGENGIYLFNPKKESTVSRRIEGIDSFVYDIDTDRKGNVWVASRSLMKVSPEGKLDTILEGEEWTSVRVAQDGSIFAASNGGGVIRITGGTMTRTGMDNSDLKDAHVSCVYPLPGGRILVGNSLGVDILDTGDGSCRHFDRDNGFRAGALERGAACALPSGKVLICGTEGIAVLDPYAEYPPQEAHSLTFDHITSAGEDVAVSRRTVLNHLQSNFSVDIADFDYSLTGSTSYYALMEGFDREWKEFDIREPLLYMNMKPGNYTLRVRSRVGTKTGFEQESIDITLKAAWYSSILARIFLLLLVVTTVTVLIRTAYYRTLLGEKARHFHNISLELRTPVNVMISQLEKFFREHGYRTKGIEDLDDIYLKAKRMHSIINDYVEDSENSEPDMVLKSERFLNAATACVERRLFSGELNVGTLSSDLNMGHTKLNETMRATCGMSTREFIEDIKMRHAKQMLLDGSYRVSEISERLGFSSPKYFAQRFRLKYGYSPGKKGPSASSEG